MDRWYFLCNNLAGGVEFRCIECLIAKTYLEGGRLLRLADIDGWRWFAMFDCAVLEESNVL
jgi:hypothetical protein